MVKDKEDIKKENTLKPGELEKFRLHFSKCAVRDLK